MTVSNTILDPTRAPQLTDARLQLHHAAQLATALGISYLPKQADDGHTNLEWRSELGALVSHVAPDAGDARIGVRAADLSLLVLDAEFARVADLPLTGETLESAASWLRSRLAERGADASRFTLTKHYTIPTHALDSGAAFDTRDSVAFAQLAAWFDTANDALSRARSRHANTSDIRCWPHHFDLAFLIEPQAGASVGVGLEPGDAYYDEPYFYVNMNPAPKASELTDALAGRGTWHTREWVGAVLPGSRLAAGHSEPVVRHPERSEGSSVRSSESAKVQQSDQVDAFLNSAIAAAIAHVTHPAAAIK